MSDFAGASIASGYARWRPAVHPLVVESVKVYTGEREVGLDVGCGAGLSTRALRRIARVCIGIDPLESMVRSAGEGMYAVGAGEALPVRRASVDLITAAGSLNYVDPDRFFPEASRALVHDGRLVVYDFSPGRSFRADGTLDRWFEEFQCRYPPPAGSARPLDPEILAEIATGFEVVHSERFERSLEMAPSFYLEYMLTETSVAHAVRSGEPPESIRRWCAESLAGVFERPREVLFNGYFVVLRPKRYL
jgi:SAM-dependent methyltransferase